MLVAGAEPRYIVYDGTALDGMLYRIVSGPSPTPDDFRSYMDLGRAWPNHEFFRATGVSFFASREQASQANARFRLGSHLAKVRLGDVRFMWAETGSHGHVTAWGHPQSFLNFVVECSEDVG